MSASTRWIGEVGYDVVTGEIKFRCWDTDDAATVKQLMLDNFEAAREQGAKERETTCAWCKQRVVEGLGGHTSRCYERKLNAIRAALDDCDDYGATEDRIRWILDGEAR